MRRLAVLAVLVPAAASAEPSPGYVYVTASVGFAGAGVSGTPTEGGPGMDFAAGGRLGEWWIRGALDMTLMGDVESRFDMLRVGIERRTHDLPNASGFFGVDVGMITGSGYHEDAMGPSSIRGGIVMPRVGYEVGGEHVRFRFELAGVLGYGRETMVYDTTTDDATGFLRGASFMLGFTVR